MEEESKSNLKQIRTFQGDAAEALIREKQSLASIQGLEVERRRRDGLEPEPQMDGAKKFILLAMGSIVLLGLAAGLGWFGYNEFVKKTTPPPAPTPTNKFLKASVDKTISSAGLTRPVLINHVAESIGLAPAGEVGEIIFEPSITTSDFFTILETRMPGALVRALDPAFMLGTLGEGSVFVVTKLVSYENAYAGMLKWEENMLADMGPVFATRDRLKNIPLESVFSDVTVSNKDMRAILSEEGEPLLLYSFYQDKMLIITDRVETLESLLSRLTHETLSR